MTIYTTTKHQPWRVQCAATEAQAPTTTLAFDGSVDQDWEGFGGCFNELSQLALLQLPQTERQAVLDDLFLAEGDGLRFNFCRIPIGASDYAESWYSCNETEGDYSMKHFSIERDKRFLIPCIHEAQRRNPALRLFASPWSPPTWMKYPKAYSHGTLVQTEENLSAYALYLLRFVEMYEREGIHIDQLHVQNEPVSSQKFPSCVWTGAELAEFIGRYLGPLFERAGVATKIWLGTLNCPETDHRALYTRYNDYANLVLHDPDAYRYVEGVGYQWAGKYALHVTRESFPEKKYIQSENECGDGQNSWAYARYVFELFRHYIAGGVCAYVYWNMALPPKGSSTWGWEQNALITIDSTAHRNHEYYVMKHFSHLIKPGARRLGLAGHFAGNSVAFRNPGGQVVIVAHNPFDRAQTFALNGQTVKLEPDSFNSIVL